MLTFDVPTHQDGFLLREEGKNVNLNVWNMPIAANVLIWKSDKASNIWKIDSMLGKKKREQMFVKLPILQVCIWPTAGSLQRQGNKTWRCMNERFNQRRSEREAAAGSVTAGPELNFWQVESSKGPAGSPEDVQPQMWKPKLISLRVQSILWLFALISLLLEKAPGLKLENRRAMNTKKGGVQTLYKDRHFHKKKRQKLLQVVEYMFEN